MKSLFTCCLIVIASVANAKASSFSSGKACDFVNAKNLGPGGCYDECVQISTWWDLHGRLHKTGSAWKNGKWIGIPESAKDGVDEKLAGACAIVLHGSHE